MRRTNGALPGAAAPRPLGSRCRDAIARGRTRTRAQWSKRDGENANRLDGAAPRPHLSGVLELEPRKRTQTPPAKRWRNYYRVYHVLSLRGLGTVFPGLHAGPDHFPSKDIAEQHALGFLAALNPPGRFLMDYAGAFPEGERAN